jgi:hypothetical protein
MELAPIADSHSDLQYQFALFLDRNLRCHQGQFVEQTTVFCSQGVEKRIGI